MTEAEYTREKERLIKKDLVSIENLLRHSFNQGMELGRKLGSDEKADELNMPWKYKFADGYHIDSNYYIPGNILIKEVEEHGKVTVDYE